MISERSCNTEYWSNDAGNAALHYKKCNFNCSNFTILIIYCIYDQRNTAFGDHKRLLSENDHKLLNGSEHQPLLLKSVT